MMYFLVAYDVSTETLEGRRRLRQVAQICTNFGQRVQKSVFECSVSDLQHERMLSDLLNAIDQDEDSLRIYRLREPRDKYIRAFGRQQFVDYEKPLIL